MAGMIARSAYAQSLPGYQSPPVQAQKVQNEVTNTAFANNEGNFQDFLSKFGRYLSPSTTSSSSSSVSGAGGNGFPLSNYGFGPAGAGGVPPAGTWTPQPAATPPPMPSLPTPQSASNPIFARAKDTVANSLNGLMKASRDAFAGRNLSGGSAELNSMGNILAAGNQQLADTARQQAITDVGTANDFAKTGYEGALTGRGQDLSAMTAQRGQDISAADAMRAAGLTARGQDMEQARASQSLSQSQSQNSLASLMGLLNAFKTLY